MLGEWNDDNELIRNGCIIGRVTTAFGEWTGWLGTECAPRNARAMARGENSAWLHSWHKTAEEAKAAIERGAVEGCEDIK